MIGDGGNIGSVINGNNVQQTKQVKYSEVKKAIQEGKVTSVQNHTKINRSNSIRGWKKCETCRTKYPDNRQRPCAVIGEKKILVMKV